MRDWEMNYEKLGSYDEKLGSCTGGVSDGTMRNWEADYGVK
jgi:hypothetical protein